METLEVPMTCIGVPVDLLAEEIVHAIIEQIESKEEKNLVKKTIPHTNRKGKLRSCSKEKNKRNHFTSYSVISRRR